MFPFDFIYEKLLVFLAWIYPYKMPPKIEMSKSASLYPNYWDAREKIYDWTYEIWNRLFQPQVGNEGWTPTVYT